MEKRYESDMTRKEKRQNELKKLKSMTFKQKAAYIWEYYKGVFAGIIIACVIISIGVQMFQNSQLKSLLSIAVVEGAFDAVAHRAGFLVARGEDQHLLGRQHRAHADRQRGLRHEGRVAAEEAGVDLDRVLRQGLDTRARVERRECK